MMMGGGRCNQGVTAERVRKRERQRERERERYSGITAFPPGVFGLHDFICEAIINFLNEISN